jgi:hypothetical protein
MPLASQTSRDVRPNQPRSRSHLLKIPLPAWARGKRKSLAVRKAPADRMNCHFELMPLNPREKTLTPF